MYITYVLPILSTSQLNNMESQFITSKINTVGLCNEENKILFSMLLNKCNVEIF